jgi:hypothetical protein
MSTFALTAKEAANVRAAAHFLRARMGGWRNVAKALRVDLSTAKSAPTPILAFRLARLVGIGVDDVLTGKYPPVGACAYCGHVAESGEETLGCPSRSATT